MIASSRGLLSFVLRNDWAKNNIKTHRQEIGWKGVAWMELTEDKNKWRAVVDTVIKLQVL
jgi:hypothetical protein